MWIFSAVFAPGKVSYVCAKMVPMLAELEQLSEDAAKLAAAPLWPVSDDELTDLLRAAQRLQQTAVVLQARLVRQAVTRGMPAAQGYRATARWLQSLLMLDPLPARELAEAATATRRPVIEQAMLDGHANARQAAVIAATIEAIPADLGNSPVSPVSPPAISPVSPPATKTAPPLATRTASPPATRTAPRVAGRTVLPSATWTAVLLSARSPGSSVKPNAR
jgi:hypothetical protein